MRFHVLRFLLVFFLASAWVFSGWPQVWDNPRIPPKIPEALADTDYIDPNGDGATGSWSATPSGSFYTTVDDAVRQSTTPTTGDYVSGSVNNAGSINFRMDSIASVDTVSQVVVWVYHNDGSNGQLAVQLFDDDESTTRSSSANLTQRTSDTWDSVTFSGLSLTQAQLDALTVRITASKNGGGSPATATVYAVYGDVTYTAASGNTLPVASGVSVDSGAASVTLTENTTTNVECAGTVTDDDGYTDITSVTADFYRSGVGTGGGTDDNNYYQLVGDSQCIPSGGSGTTETYTCTFAIQYFADPTDNGSPNDLDIWKCDLTPSDSVGAGTAASDTIEMASLLALSVTSSIDYGSINPDSDSGTLNETTTITNTGNRDMDPQLSGIDMSDGGSNTIGVANQEYTDSDAIVSYGSGTDLSVTPTTLNLTLPQRTGLEITDQVYWGLGVPLGTPSGTYTGTNTFTAVAGI